MAYVGVTLPLTGSGDATAAPAVDIVGGLAYQAMKLVDGAEGSTNPVRASGTTPGSTDHGLVTRPIGSTAHNQAIVGAVALTSEGSTKLAGRVTVDNPTTSVNIANPTTAVNVANPTTLVNVSSGVVLGAGSSDNMLGAVTQGTPAGSSANAWWVRTVSTQTGAAGATTVDANLTSVGSTRLIGRVTNDNPTTLVNVSSGVILGAGSSANTLGAMAQGAGSTAVAPWYVISSASAGAGSTAVDATLTSGGSTRQVGTVLPGLGSSANYWYQQTIPFSSGNLAITTVNTSADAAVLAANANRKALLIQNLTTVDIALGFTTAAMTTALAGCMVVLSGRQIAGGGSYITFGPGGLPLYLGPIRGRTIGSTTISGGVSVVQYT